jgi:hypothetical protein
MPGEQVGELWVDIRARMAGLEKDLASAKKRLDKHLGDTDKRVSSWAKTLSTTGKALSVGVTLPLMLLGRQASEAASDYNESLNKMQVVFKQNAAQIQTWSETAATSLGMSRQEALETSSTFGNLFTSMGIGSQQAAGMSVQMIQLAADLSSFNNIDPSEAFEKLRSGIVGEAEPLRTLGVNLMEVDVQQKALAMGLASTTKELTVQDKVLARLALITEQTKNAQGDFARTAEGVANAQRIATAEYKNALATIGQQLLPVKLKLVKSLTELLQEFQALDPAGQKLVVTLGAIAAAAGPVLIVAGQTVTALTTLKGAMVAVGAVAGGGALIGSIVTAGALADVIAITAALGKYLEMRAKVAELEAAANKQAADQYAGLVQVVKTSLETMRKHAEDPAIGAAINRVQAALEKTKTASNDLARAEAWNTLQAELNKLAGVSRGANGQVQADLQKVKRQADIAAQGLRGTTDAAKSIRSAAGVWSAFIDVLRNAYNWVNKLTSRSWVMRIVTAMPHGAAAATVGAAIGAGGKRPGGVLGFSPEDRAALGLRYLPEPAELKAIDALINDLGRSLKWDGEQWQALQPILQQVRAQFRDAYTGAQGLSAGIEQQIEALLLWTPAGSAFSKQLHELLAMVIRQRLATEEAATAQAAMTAAQEKAKTAAEEYAAAERVLAEAGRAAAAAEESRWEGLADQARNAYFAMQNEGKSANELLMETLQGEAEQFAAVIPLLQQVIDKEKALAAAKQMATDAAAAQAQIEAQIRANMAAWNADRTKAEDLRIQAMQRLGQFQQLAIEENNRFIAQLREMATRVPELAVELNSLADALTTLPQKAAPAFGNLSTMVAAWFQGMKINAQDAIGAVISSLEGLGIKSDSIFGRLLRGAGLLLYQQRPPRNPRRHHRRDRRHLRPRRGRHRHLLRPGNGGREGAGDTQPAPWRERDAPAGRRGRRSPADHHRTTRRAGAGPRHRREHAERPAPVRSGAVTHKEDLLLTTEQEAALMPIFLANTTVPYTDEERDEILLLITLSRSTSLQEETHADAPA